VKAEKWFYQPEYPSRRGWQPQGCDCLTLYYYEKVYDIIIHSFNYPH